MNKVVKYLLIFILIAAIFSIGSHSASAAESKTYQLTKDRTFKDSKTKKQVTMKKGTKFKSNYTSKNNILVLHKGNKVWVPKKSLKVVNVGKGKIEGAVTWHQYTDYNVNNETKTIIDVGAKILAFPDGGVFKQITNAQLKSAVYSTPSTYGVYTTRSDKYGNYKLSLPPGKYWVLIVSSKNKRDSELKQYDYYYNPIMSRYVKKYSTDTLLMTWHNYDFKNITVTKNKTYTLNTDWEYIWY